MNDLITDSTKSLRKEYYNFEKYVTPERMLTYWHQLNEVLSLKPTKMLEIGKGSGIVEFSSKAFGVSVETVDYNENLEPDHVMSVLDVGTRFKEEPYDVVLCARVLHHLPHEQFGVALKSLSEAGRFLVLTLPVDDLRFYLSIRLTSRRAHLFSVPFPRKLKDLILRITGKNKEYYAKLWKINSCKATRLKEVKAIIAQHFDFVKDYSIPEDRSHYLFVLRSRSL